MFLNEKKRLSAEVTRLLRRENWGGICEELQKDLIKLSDWVINQKNTFNVDKCSDAHGRKFQFHIIKLCLLNCPQKCQLQICSKTQTEF